MQKKTLRRPSSQPSRPEAKRPALRREAEATSDEAEVAVEEERQQAISRRRKWYWILFGAGAIMLAVSAVFAMVGVLDETERRLFTFINHAYLPEWVTEQIAKPISDAVWGMAALVGVLLLVPRFRLLAWQYVVAVGSSFVAATAIEHIVNRVRPVGLPMYDPVMRVYQDGLGYPSTHVAIVTALVLTAWPYLAWPWRIVLALFVVAEAWSRIFLGVHAPFDVAGGMAVAMVAVAALRLLPAKFRKICKLAA